MHIADRWATQSKYYESQVLVKWMSDSLDVQVWLANTEQNSYTNSGSNEYMQDSSMQVWLIGHLLPHSKVLKVLHIRCTQIILPVTKHKKQRSSWLFMMLFKYWSTFSSEAKLGSSKRHYYSQTAILSAQAKFALTHRRVTTIMCPRVVMGAYCEVRVGLGFYFGYSFPWALP